MKDDYTTNSHYLTSHIAISKIGRMYFFELGSERFKQQLQENCIRFSKSRIRNFTGKSPRGHSRNLPAVVTSDSAHCLLIFDHTTWCPLVIHLLMHLTWSPTNLPSRSSPQLLLGCLSIRDLCSSKLVIMSLFPRVTWLATLGLASPGGGHRAESLPAAQMPTTTRWPSARLTKAILTLTFVRRPISSAPQQQRPSLWWLASHGLPTNRRPTFGVDWATQLHWTAAQRGTPGRWSAGEERADSCPRAGLSRRKNHWRSATWREKTQGYTCVSRPALLSLMSSPQSTCRF